LKNRLKKEGNESVTNCNQLKLLAADGKRYLSDVADQEQLFRIIQSVPSPLVGGGFFIASKLSTELRSVNSFFARKIFAILKYNFKFAHFFLHNFMKNTFKIQIIPLFSCTNLKKAVPSDTALAEANSPVATFARCSPYSSSLVIICKNDLHFAIRYPPLRFQA
jgi:hypothetical protein